MEESTDVWPVGLRFKPTEDELIGHHLTKKLRGGMEAICVIPELDIYNCEPPELFTRYNELSSIPSDRSECFFFCPRDGGQKRKTRFGFWKETSTKRFVRAPDTGEEIGLRRSLVYHKGPQRNAHRTNIGMYEYHLNSNVSDSEISDPTALVLCHITNKKSEKAKSATVSTSTDLSGPSNLNNSQDEGTPEISAQTSPAETVEPKSSTHTTLNHDMPDSSVSVPQQPHMLGMERSFCDDNWLVDGTSDEHYAQYSPNDGIYFSDLWSFD
ncbi:NAC domain-containing protein 71-like isoform X6 [Rhodamnia argentea]|uniref:NAC domain-containing protein 71-like isoform X6 n=1 Tax=Rhodamnia argentea TaxID=178133 RepID=A0A8B8PU18_9MYRT|nr:NAC domain-containing protein 71-like isoform X6 [Rhodamnia argentea]